MADPPKQRPVSKAFKAKGGARDSNVVEGPIENPSNQPLLDRKTAQEMESTRHTKANESTKEKKLRQHADRSRRHAREYA